MQYFKTLPKVIQVKNQVATVLTNLMNRADVIPSLLTNPLIFYKYDIQDGDTPETVAYKYYGDSYRYWILLYSNQIMNPLWDWPLNSNDFNKYIDDKYQEFNPYSTVYQYQKIITQVDLNTNTTTINTVVIDEPTYNGLTQSQNTYTLPTGPVSVTITKNTVSYYQYELNLNESKRSINILNKNYAGQLEKEFKSLMSQ